MATTPGEPATLQAWDARVADALGRWGGWGPPQRDHPFPLFAEVRSRCPVQSVTLADGHEAFVVLGHGAARAALNDPRMSKDMTAALAADRDVVAEGLPGPYYARHMVNSDPPDHTRLRRLVARAFAPPRVTALEPAVGDLVDRLLDGIEADVEEGEVVDLVARYAGPLPFGVICELLGIPARDRDRLRGWFRDLLVPWSGDPPPSAQAASDGITGYLAELVDTKRREPGDDLVTVLMSANEEGGALDRRELLSSLFQLFVAGHDTTTSLIGNSVVALLDEPDQLETLRADPAKLAGAIDELVRFTAPVPHATFRVTTEPVELDGVEVPAGRQVLVCLAAADRDPSVFADPDRLDLERPTRGHLGFGHGIHSCLGASLARMEARLALGRLLDRFDLALAVPREELAWSHGDGLVLRGLASLPVRLQVRRSGT